MNAHPKMPRSNYAVRLKEFPDIALAVPGVFQHRGRWAKFFAERIGPKFDGRIILEIGCFDAGYLAHIAAEHPHTSFVGIDWKCKAIYDGAARISMIGLRNVVLLRVRGQDLLNMFAQAELDEIWIFHPDPCDREHERKNRLINERFLLDVHSLLRTGTSAVFVKTDNQSYRQSVLDLFVANNVEQSGAQASALGSHFELTVNSTDYWHDAIALSQTAARLFSGKKTLFENRFIRRRQPIFFVEMRKI